MLREGKLDDKEIEIDVAHANAGMEILAPPGMEELTQQIQGMFQNMGGARRKRRTLAIREALRLITDEEALRLVNEEEIRFKALAAVEQNGIVFLDEIDKIASRGEMQGADVSRQGVQRDLLPLVEALECQHQVRHGAHRPSSSSRAAPSRLSQSLRPHPRAAGTPSHPRGALQPLGGRLRAHPRLHRRVPHPPIPGAPRDRGRGARVHAPRGVRRIAEIAFSVNERTENIGARRLYTVMEKLLEEVSFDAGRKATRVTIDATYVDAKLASLAQSEDLARYVL